MDIRSVTLSILKIPEVTDRETVDSLKESIKQNGLLHPITINENGNIIAGIRRAQAIKEMGYDEITCNIFSSMTEDQYSELTIQENLSRHNLPWFEEVVMKKNLFDIRQRQLGKSKSGRPSGAKKGFSLRDLANELQEGLGTLSQDLRLAEAVMADPNLCKIGDKVTAQRIIFQKASRIEAEVEAAMPTKIDYNSVLCGDASEVLKHFPDQTFNVCFTDPPWLNFRDSNLVKDDSTLPVFKEVYRVLKMDSFLYVICSTPDFWIYLQQLTEIGFQCQQMPLIWAKENVVTHGLRSWEYMRDYEPIMLAVKGKPVLAVQTSPHAYYQSKAVHNLKSIHPNEKPWDVPAHFLNHCSYEGSLVLDPFGGSGSTAEACVRTGRKYVIIERDKQFATGIENRLSSLKLDA
jgi:site-specific DNA-methyltransferase (adenine-specific)